MKNTNDNYAELMNAIVKQAADDYISTKKSLYKINNGFHTYIDVEKKNDRIDVLETRLKEVMAFFNSKWYKALCKIDSEWLIQKLDEKVEEWKTSEEFKKWKIKFYKKLNMGA